MKLPTLENDRFTTEEGVKIVVQVPDQHAQQLIDAILAEDFLKYGDYENVAFKTSTGVQQFRPLGTGRNTETEAAVEVPCVEISFFLKSADETTSNVLKAIYSAHPYEEPVVFVYPCLRTLHIRGIDEDNPNRFWNRPAEDWVPEEHR